MPTRWMTAEENETFRASLARIMLRAMAPSTLHEAQSGSSIRIIRSRLAAAQARVAATPEEATAEAIKQTLSQVLTAQLSKPGHSISLYASVAGGAREIQVTRRLGFTYVIRRLTLAHNGTFGDAMTAQLYVSDDNDTVQTQYPTGENVIWLAGEAPAGVDPGWMFASGNNPASIEPFYRVTRTPTYLKFKMHNGTGLTRIYQLIADLDEI